MATEVTYNGDGSNKTFSITFPFIKSDDVKVQVGGSTLSASDYSITGTVVTTDTAPASGTGNVKLYRVTPIDYAVHDFSAGSTIRAKNLNDNQKQVLYGIEETKLVTVTSGGITTGAKNDIHVNSDSDWYIRNDAVEQSMLADNSVGTDQIINDAVTSLKLKDDASTDSNRAVTTNHIRDSAITVAKLNNDAVETVKIKDDAVTYAKVQNVATANRVLGSTSAGGVVSEVQITTDMIADGAVTTAKTSGGAGVPTGTVIWYAGNTAPTGYLKCNGDAIANGSGTTQSITADFSALYAIVGANLPDLRGEFIRGWDDGKGTDSGRTIRSTQADDFKSHQHTSDGARFGSNSTHPGDNFYSSAGDNAGNSVVNSINATGGTETRPRNVALLACIKY